MNIIISLLLMGQINSTSREEYLNHIKNDCFLYPRMRIILNSKPDLWKVRFKRALRYDSFPESCLYGLSNKEIKDIIKDAEEFGIELK